MEIEKGMLWILIVNNRKNYNTERKYYYILLYYLFSIGSMGRVCGAKKHKPQKSTRESRVIIITAEHGGSQSPNHTGTEGTALCLFLLIPFFFLTLPSCFQVCVYHLSIVSLAFSSVSPLVVSTSFPPSLHPSINS